MKDIFNSNAPAGNEPKKIAGLFKTLDTKAANPFALDKNLQRTLKRYDPAFARTFFPTFNDIGRWLPQLDAQADASDRHLPPRLETAQEHADPLTQRAIVNSAYEDCHQETYKHGLIDAACNGNAGPMAAFIGMYLYCQADISIGCPNCMTHGVLEGLNRILATQDFSPGIKAQITNYRDELSRIDGQTMTGGTWATEEHSGSDVGGTTTKAIPLGNDAFALEGFKFFASNATGQIAVATARPEGAPAGVKGLGLYLVPSYKPDGQRNDYAVEKLKEKMGTKGLATGEIRLNGAYALELVPPPHGLRAMMEILANSRVHNAMAAAGVTWRALLEAKIWTTFRKTWGKPLIEQPLIKQDLLDLVVEHESAFALSFAAADAYEAATKDPTRQPWARLVTAMAKYRTAEQAVHAMGKTQILIGGTGYTGDSPVERLLRDAHVARVWEGPENIQALEELRLMKDHPAVIGEFIDYLEQSFSTLPADLKQVEPKLQGAVSDLKAAVHALAQAPNLSQQRAKTLLDLMCDCYSSALLVEEAAEDLALGDKRKALVTERYIEKTFSRNPYLLDFDPAVTHFDSIINYERVPSAPPSGPAPSCE